jgi:transcriptional regulator with XRE-family HTH domain
MASSGKRRKTASSSDADSGSSRGGGRAASGPGPDPDGDGENHNNLGSFIRAQRERANLSLRQLSGMTAISNAYLSQIERGLHEPSIRVVKSVAEALGISPEALLAKAGLTSDQADDAAAIRRPPTEATEQAIMEDQLLEPSEKQALIAVYRSYVADRF